MLIRRDSYLAINRSTSAGLGQNLPTVYMCVYSSVRWIDTHKATQEGAVLFTLHGAIVHREVCIGKIKRTLFVCV